MLSRLRVGLYRAAPYVIVAAPLAILLAGAIDRRWMNEDGFINLRVVRNWLAGNGLVFNLDERVEATTSTLWLWILLLLGRIGLRLEYAAAYGGIVLTFAGAALAEWASWRTHPRARRGERLGFAVPLGAAIVAVLPPLWDYASSGLETGLCLAWLGGAYCAVAFAAIAPAGRPSLPALAAMAVLVGLGPLARPELALYAAPFLVILGAVAARAQFTAGASLVRALAAFVLVFAAAAVVPVATEIFRMGYYASSLPNTAIAKEAFAANEKQGVCYFNNFFGTYWMGFPLGGAAVFAIARLGDEVARRRWLAAATTLSPVLAGTLHVTYLVVIGGDYMHGRLLVPAVFGALLPVMAIPLPPPRRLLVRLALGLAATVCAVWIPLCAVHLRVGIENVCNIGDERGWYTRKAVEPHPVRIDDYREHPFYADALKSERKIETDCTGEASPPPGVVGCHRVYAEEEDAPVSPLPASSPLSPAFEGLAGGRVTAVVTAGAIGIVGYLLPDSVHVVDHHGLSDPIVGHFELLTRGRPGHEKKASAAWMLARFAAPAADDDSGVVAARHALSCGKLAAFVRATEGPLTWRGFFDNMSHAFEYSKLRIPRDPYEAEARFCGTPLAREYTTGGGGGTPFRWLCPAGHPLTGLRGEYAVGGKALSRIQPLCGLSGDLESGEAIVGPHFGDSADQSFEVSCPSDAPVVGFFGMSDDLTRSVGLTCAGPRGIERTSSGGVTGGRLFQVGCPRQGTVYGVAGRSGALVDSLGVLCAP